MESPLPPGPALYIVATPIGNLEDITIRALRILKGVDLVFCEDTRTTARILNRYEMHTPLKSFRVHRLEEDLGRALSALREDKNVAFCSEAGTPGLSDPGADLVRRVREDLPEVPIIPLPGAAAVTCAVSISGMKASPFLFLGFLSPRGGRRKRALEEQTGFEGMIVLYESVHRIEKTVSDIVALFPDRDLLIVREATKLYEDIQLLRAPHHPDEVPRILAGITRKGEFSLIIGPKK